MEKFKRNLAFLLAVVMMVTMLPMTVFAEGTAQVGSSLAQETVAGQGTGEAGRGVTELDEQPAPVAENEQPVVNEQAQEMPEEQAVVLNGEGDPEQSFSVGNKTFVEALEGCLVRDSLGDEDNTLTDKYVQYDLDDAYATLVYEGITYEGSIYDICNQIDDEYGEWPSVSWEGNDQSYANQWKANETHSVTATILGMSATFDVTIAPNPVTEFTIENMTLTEGIDGYENRDHLGWNEETGESIYSETYTKYDYWNDGRLSARIAYGDTGEYTGTLIQVIENIEEVTGIDITTWGGEDSQSYETPWTAGNTYPATINISGMYADLDVTIAPNPVTEFTIANQVIEEGTSGYIGQDYTWNPETDKQETSDYYWKYYQDSYHIANATIVYDGVTYEGTLSQMSSKLGELTGDYVYCDFDYDQPQTYETPWVAGETYTTTVTMGGKSATFDTTITPGKLSDVSVENITMTEDEGTLGSDYDYKTWTTTYFWRYNVANNANMKITFAYDGKTYSGTYAEVRNKLYELTGNNPQMQLNSEQSSDNPWVAGKKYAMTLYIGAKSADFNVTIEKGQFDTLSIEDTSVEWQEGKTYYLGSIAPDVTYESDGKSYTCSASQLKKQTGYSLVYQSDKNTYNWVVNGTYQVTGWLGGKNATFNVTVIESQVDSIECENLIIEKADSYSIVPKFAVVKKDGERIESVNGRVSYGGTKYSFQVDSYGTPIGNWTAGNTYTVNGTVMGKSGSFEVTIEDKDYTNLEISGNNELVLSLTDTNGEKTQWITDSASFASRTVYGNSTNGTLSIAGSNITGSLFSGNRQIGNVTVTSGGNTSLSTADDINVTWNGMTSNTLSGNTWLRAHLLETVAMEYLAEQHGYGFGYDVKQDFNGEITENNIQTVMQFAKTWGMGIIYKNSNLRDFYAADEIEQAIKSVFGIDVNLEDYGVVDDDGNVQVNWVGKGYGGGTTSLQLVDDNWVCTYGDDQFPEYKVVMNSEGYVTYFGFNEHTEHSMKYVRAKAPTCEEDGNIAYYECTVCGKHFSDSAGKKELDRSKLKKEKLGHNYVDGKCTNCGESNPIASGTCGTAATWALYPDGLMKILGSGAMADYAAKDVTPSWSAYSDQIKSVVVGAGITTIGQYAFMLSTNLESVSLPDSLTKISEGAFSDCTSLKSITLPKNVKELTMDAFTRCTSLEHINVDKDNKYFSDADGLLIENGNTLLFCARDKAGTVVIPDGVTKLNSEAFNDCVKVTRVEIPEGVKEIPDRLFSVYAFQETGCAEMAEVVLPSTITDIDARAFEVCGLEDVYYGGTEADKALINITNEEQASGKKLANATWHYAQTITYMLNGGINSEDNPATYIEGCREVVLADAVKVGYTFAGWYADEECTEKVTSIDKMATGAKMFYAKWACGKKHLAELIKTDAKEATAEASGNSEYYTCPVCGKYFQDEDGNVEISKDSWIIKYIPVEVPFEKKSGETMADAVAKVFDIEDEEQFSEEEQIALQDDSAAIKIWATTESVSDTVEEEKKEAIVEEAENMVENAVVVEFVEINLFKQISTEDEVLPASPLTETKQEEGQETNKITITVEVPASVLEKDPNMEKNYFIARVHEGECDLIPLVYDAVNNVFTFESGKFSTYAIVIEDALPEAELAKGDINGNGAVNIVDAQVLYDIAKGMYTGHTNYTRMRGRCDVNGDSEVNALDARAVQYYVHNGEFGE